MAGVRPVKKSRCERKSLLDPWSQGPPPAQEGTPQGGVSGAYFSRFNCTENLAERATGTSVLCPKDQVHFRVADSAQTLLTRPPHLKRNLDP